MLDEPIARAARLAEGKPAPGDADWFAAGLAIWLRHAGRLPLERCCRLPTAGRLALARRNAALVAAAHQLLPEARDARDLAERLSAELRRYGRTWRGVDTLPAGAGPLRCRLHEALAAAGGATLGAKQLQRIVGHVFSEKCPGPVRTMGTPQEDNP